MNSAKKTTILFKKLVVPVGMRSIYWKYFGFPGNEDGEILTREKIICTLCKTQMAYNGNTSNLRMHLQNKHAPHLLNLEATSPPYIPKSREKLKAPKRRADSNPMVHPMAFDGAVTLGHQGNTSQSPQNSSGVKFISIGDGNNESSSIEYITADSLGDTVTYYLPEDNTPPGPSGSQPTDRDLTETVLKFLTSELMPPTMIDSPGFQRLISKLNPTITLPSFKEMDEEVIPQHYVDLKNGIISEIESLNDISLSVEEWSGVEGQSFITISIHFLHEDQLVTRILPTLQWNKDNQDIINKTLTLWSILKEKISAIVVASSDSDLLKTLEQWAPTVPCFLFILQQAISSCLNLTEVENVIHKCRNILNGFKVQQSFSDEQLSSYNITRDYPKLWTSTYDLLQEFVNNKCEIQTLTSSSTHKLSTADWNVLQTIVDTLSPFKVTVQTLQEENPALLSIIKPLLWQLVTNYSQIKENESTLAETMKILLKSKLSSAFNDKTSNILLQTATTLDPRFKQLSYATDEEVAAIQQNIKHHLSRIVEEHGDSQPSTSSSPSLSLTKKRVSGMELLLGDLCSMKQEVMRPVDRAELELGQYTSESSIAFDDNPLQWWHNAESKSPNMSRLAKKYMCIPACAIPSARIPNKERELFERQRSTLSLDYVDKIIFLNGNLM